MRSARPVVHWVLGVGLAALSIAFLTNAYADPPADTPAATTAPAAKEFAPAKKPAAKKAATTDAKDAVQPAANAKRPDRLELDTSVVTGNRELPKVLYIVPWKKAELGDLPGQPFNTLLDEALAPVDRDVFRREVNYYQAVAAGTSAPASKESK